MSNVFEQVSKVVNSEGSAEGFTIEHAMQINQKQGQVCAGIFIEANKFHAPVFLSVDELREMADEADKRTQAFIDGQK